MKSRRAKVLFEVCGAPMITWPFARALEAGVKSPVVVVGHEAQSVENKVNEYFPGQAKFAFQAERKGTGHAAQVGLNALEGFEGNVFILSGDVPLLETSTLEKLSELTDDKEQPLSLVSTILDNPTGYGRIVRNAQGQVQRIVEHKDATEEERQIDEINGGIYCANAAFLRSALSKLSNNNAQGEYYLTDIVGIALSQGLKVAGLVVSSEEIQGANSRAQLAQLEAAARQKIIQKHLTNGITFIDPLTTYVEATVQIGSDSTIYPNVHLRGTTHIGAECTIDVGSVLTDSIVGDNVAIHPYSVLEKAEVQSKANIGPFARLRPNTLIGEGAKVGNFVEMKNTTIGTKSKVNHLTYLGNAELGSGCNIGAGTITCNYDGVGKYQTQIGNNVFVGSNNTLVAPLEVGDDAYLAAGSTITDKVSNNALALGRARQIEKPERAEQIRQKAAERAGKTK